MTRPTCSPRCSRCALARTCERFSSTAWQNRSAWTKSSGPGATISSAPRPLTAWRAASSPQASPSPTGPWPGLAISICEMATGMDARSFPVCSTFLNFGKNYAGARDEYVYVYTHDNDSAYLPSDRFVLARVPKQRLRERAAYDFFEWLDEHGKPVWARDINRRGAVFTHSGNCYRSSVAYNVALKRSLLCQALPGGDPRFAGGFGIYDAAEPWGPWTCVYFAENWDVGPGETQSFPTKWMSADGKGLYLVFSGDDCFS